MQSWCSPPCAFRWRRGQGQIVVVVLCCARFCAPVRRMEPLVAVSTRGTAYEHTRRLQRLTSHAAMLPAACCLQALSRRPTACRCSRTPSRAAWCCCWAMSRVASPRRCWTRWTRVWRSPCGASRARSMRMSAARWPRGNGSRRAWQRSNGSGRRCSAAAVVGPSQACVTQPDERASSLRLLPAAPSGWTAAKCSIMQRMPLHAPAPHALHLVPPRIYQSVLGGYLQNHQPHSRPTYGACLHTMHGLLIATQSPPDCDYHLSCF